MKYVSVVIVAGGSGTRMGTKVKKQYLQIGQKEVLAHTVEVFNSHPQIQEIVVVTGKEDIPFVEDLLCAKYGYKKISEVVEGGKERQDSVYNGICATNKEADYIMIHDGARPLISNATITKALEETYDKQATIVAVPVKDTIKIGNSHQYVIQTPPREQLWSVQTPQTFEAQLIKRAYESAKVKGVYGTDDSMLVEALGEVVTIVQGEYTNIKITTPEDLVIAESILKQKSKEC